ncbi:hypothetical protein K438DRAFT_1787526 [Mycena galopus ATCC 62051]|nr:hypothetical protein K438DRAFT_1787526 [Mycena galopus ATCC 62051]
MNLQMRGDAHLTRLLKVETRRASQFPPDHSSVKAGPGAAANSFRFSALNKNVMVKEPLNLHQLGLDGEAKLSLIHKPRHRLFFLSRLFSLRSHQGVQPRKKRSQYCTASDPRGAGAGGGAGAGHAGREAGARKGLAQVRTAAGELLREISMKVAKI